jgi:hypothetical protein
LTQQTTFSHGRFTGSVSRWTAGVWRIRECGIYDSQAVLASDALRLRDVGHGAQPLRSELYRTGAGALPGAGLVERHVTVADLN